MEDKAPEQDQSTDPVDTPDTVASISGRLSEDQAAAAQHDPTQPTGQDAPAFDISSLSPDQLQQLKMMLNVTPDRATQKKANPVILLRRIQGKFVVDFKDARLALVYDATRMSEVETLVMPVRFLDDPEGKFVDVLYKDFMTGDQVKCEVVKSRDEKDYRVEGSVVQRESGRLVDMEVWTVNRFFTVKLPDGRLIEIGGKVSNA